MSTGQISHPDCRDVGRSKADRITTLTGAIEFDHWPSARANIAAMRPKFRNCPDKEKPANHPVNAGGARLRTSPAKPKIPIHLQREISK
jgi:hypothetical protein